MPDPTADILHQEIANLDHLNGIIYEALRLYPPVPTALERLTPPDGIEIGGVYIPGNMTVFCPQYAIGRSKETQTSRSISLEYCSGSQALTSLAEEEIYTHASTFIPERWYLHPEMVKENSAWAPFSIGTFLQAELSWTSPSLLPLLTS